MRCSGSKLQVIQDTADYPIARRAAWIFLSRTVTSGCVPPGSGPSYEVHQPASSMPSNFFQANGFLQMMGLPLHWQCCRRNTTLFETDFFGLAGTCRSPVSYMVKRSPWHMARSTLLARLFVQKNPGQKTPQRVLDDENRRWLSMTSIWTWTSSSSSIRAVVADILEHCKQELETLGRQHHLPGECGAAAFSPCTHTTMRAHHPWRAGRERKEQHSDPGSRSRGTSCEKAECEKEIAEREAKIAAGGMKKGEVNFSRTRSIR